MNEVIRILVRDNEELRNLGNLEKHKENCNTLKGMNLVLTELEKFADKNMIEID